MISIMNMMKIHEENGGKFPEGAGDLNFTQATAAAYKEVSARPVPGPTESEIIDAAKTELRKLAMVMHNEARAVLQNVFMCPADVSEALDHLSVAYHAIENSLHSPKITNAINLTK